MVRRRSPAKPRIPAGWTPHKGGGCPVHPDSKPAVMFRIGSKTPRDMQTAEHWINMSAGSCWEWEEGSRAPMDIIAYWEEEEMIEIPRLYLSRPAGEQGF